MLCRFSSQSQLLGGLGVHRRPCPFHSHRPVQQDDLMRHMAAARFGPSLLSSLLAAAEPRINYFPARHLDLLDC